MRTINKAMLPFLLLILLAPVVVLAQDPVGNIDVLQGQADVVRNATAPASISQGAEVFRTDELITRAESWLEVALSDGSRFTLDENSRVAISEYATGTSPRGLMGLARGRLRSSVSNAFSNNADSYQVQTREGVMGVQGTEFEVLALPGETQVFVYEGIVSATSRDPRYPETRMLRAGDFLRIRLNEPLPPTGQFFGFAGTGDGYGIESGAELDRQSSGLQVLDPLLTTPDVRGSAGDVTQVPPRPNPPGQ